MRRLLQILFRLKNRKLFHFITNTLSIGTCICAKIGRINLFTHKEASKIMIDKFYFKIEFFMKKKAIKDAIDYVKEVNNKKGFECVVLQNIHTSKKIPELQFQVMGNDVVKSLVQVLTKSKYSHGYILWMSKQEDFFATKSLHLLDVGYTNVINNSEKDVRVEKSTVSKEVGSDDE